MYLDYTTEQYELRDQLRVYFAEVMREPAVDPTDRVAQRARYRAITRRLGADGWLGIGWPREYGGQGRSSLEQFIFFDEAQRAGVPVPTIALNTVGPTLMHFGSEEQKQYYLPRIIAGLIDFSIGYTEPSAGTDLASLATRAVRRDDVYVVNGNKIFTTGGEISDYIWLAVRTDVDAPKHKGISILIVPTTSAGFSVTPIHTMMARSRPTTATYYNDVEVPVANRVGEENAGWRLITTQLNHERVAMAAYGGLALQLLDDVRAWAARTPYGDGHLFDQNWVRLVLAGVDARLEAMKLLNWQMAWAVGDGSLAPAGASAAKVYSTETVIESIRALLDLVGPAGYLTAAAQDAPLGGRLESAYREVVVGTFGGGNNDIQREIIATAGLHMPRAPR
ncbi:MAG: 3-oxocholest-4-en-26-oyl-CoA dehydrogenase alpha subunit [Micromonosporaceae bacterium]|jgi:alkylation response protein AidB-like acyl-CoA dehydrogenase|nr:3-oxocholest-4-en-26-oyl-CoA dehydrogenase alpha subunit [Micromonosporaceae bacterium]